MAESTVTLNTTVTVGPTPTLFTGTLPSVFGPLTTDFSAPSSCFNVPVQCVDGECNWLEPFRTCGLDGYPTAAPECYPSGNEEEDFAAWDAQSKELVYAPATGCPGGWESIQGRRTIECCPSGFTLATPTETAFAGQTSCVSDILYTASDFTATVCGAAGTDPSLTTFMSEPSLAVVWAKRILVVPETTEDENSSSSSRVRSSRTASESETSTAEESAVGTPIETAEESATGAGGVTSRLPSASPTAAAAGGRLGVIGGVFGVVVGVLAIMLVVV